MTAGSARWMWAGVCALLLVGAGHLIGQDSARPFPEDSPEHGALVAASPYLDNPDFQLRQDYWRGEVSTRSGKAIRLQFFKGNRYRFFFSAAPGEVDERTRLSLEVYNTASREVAKVRAEPGQSVIALSLDPPATGLYLVLMRAERSGEGNPYHSFPAVLFYGFE